MLRFCTLIVTLLFPVFVMAQSNDSLTLTQAQASSLAKLPLKCVRKEYPNKLDHVMNDKGEVLSPKTLHPAFYGCFDWHSSVHGHWMLVRLLKTFPNLPEANEIRAALNENLSAENISGEIAYLKQGSRQSFERTYGWAWLLKLAEELHGWNDADGKKWAANLAPLAQAFAEKYVVFLPKQTYPIRTGVHPNTAFGLAFALDYANTIGDKKLAEIIIERSRTYYGNDKNYPAAWEPGGEDFFSASLMEADLMRRVLKPAEFKKWFADFLPSIPNSLLTPAIVADRSDPKIVHLDGLNLSRAWCMKSIAAALPKNDPAQKILRKAAEAHAKSALPNITSGNYEGEHWLASFAVYLLARK
jgi:hypothetical protein